MPTYQVATIGREKAWLVEKSAAWNTDGQMQAQFRWCVNGGEDGLTKCVVLRTEKDNSCVGFLGLTLTTEDLQSVVNAYVAVEFVYLHPSVRKRGLGSHFIESIIAKVRAWLDDQAEAFSERNVVLYSASNVKSDGGEHFIRRLEASLFAEARSRGLSFSSCIDDDG